MDGDCVFKVPCIKEQIMKATKDGGPWKQWVTSNRGECWFECYLVPRDNHCIFSSLKWKISCHGSVSILCLRINNCHLIFLIFYCIRLIDPATCSWAGLLSFLNRCCIYLIVNGTGLFKGRITLSTRQSLSSGLRYWFSQYLSAVQWFIRWKRKANWTRHAQVPCVW